MYSIILIVPYFGKLPDSFPLWLRSCSINPTIHWLFMTDQDLSEYDIPSNIKVKYTDLAEMRSTFQKHFDFPISLERPYKLCDFRPAYGEVFEEALRAFSFWGYCDIDLVFGNLRHFLTQDILNSCERAFVQGHLSVYKNNQKMNSLYKTKVENCLYYKDVFSSSQAFAFDEFGYKGLGGMCQITQSSHIVLHNEIIYADLMEKYYGFKCDFGGSPEQRKLDFGKKKVYFEFSSDKLSQHWGKNGSQEREIGYVHIHKRKMQIHCLDTSHYYIYPGEYTNQKKKHFRSFGANPEYIKWRINRNLYYSKNPDYVKWRIKKILTDKRR